MNHKIGDIVYFHSGHELHMHQMKTNTRAKVHQIFVGADGDEHLVLEVHGRDQRYSYHLRKSFNVSKKKGVSLHELTMANPELLRRIGVDAGIWDKDGKLMPAYRS